jgi:ElaA protein
MNESNESSPLSSAATFDWRWKPFAGLDTKEVYALLGARSAVFVVEQHCVYGDIDGLDIDAWHLLAYAANGGREVLAGYLRVLVPDAEDSHVRIGRVLTTSDFRGIGLGDALLETALAHIARQWPGVPVRLHAQAHLQRFYGAFGFVPVSDIHDEDGIAHVWMRRAA